MFNKLSTVIINYISLFDSDSDNDCNILLFMIYDIRPNIN